jgi:hypothetical protein
MSRRNWIIIAVVVALLGPCACTVSSAGIYYMLGEQGILKTGGDAKDKKA